MLHLFWFFNSVSRAHDYVTRKHERKSLLFRTDLK